MKFFFSDLECDLNDNPKEHEISRYTYRNLYFSRNKNKKKNKFDSYQSESKEDKAKIDKYFNMRSIQPKNYSK